MTREYMPELIGGLFFISTLAAKVGAGDSFDLVALAPYGMFAIVMVLLLRYIPGERRARTQEIKEIIQEIHSAKDKEIERIVKILKK